MPLPEIHELALEHEPKHWAMRGDRVGCECGEVFATKQLYEAHYQNSHCRFEAEFYKKKYFALQKHTRLLENELRKTDPNNQMLTEVQELQEII